MAKITLFSQVIGKLPKENFRKIIRTAGTDRHCKGYDTLSQFVSMVFCQFSQCGSVRDISNAHRDSGVFRDIFYALYRHFGQQGQWQRNKFRFKMPIKLLDSTLVSLTISVYEWAHHTTKKGAVKMHTLLDYDCTAQPLGQQQCVFRSQAQGQHPLHFHRGAAVARETRAGCSYR